MVKPDAIAEVTEPDGHRLTQVLRREGQNLSQTKHLLQKTPVTPLQMHDAGHSADPVLISAGHPVAVLSDANGQSASAVAKARPHWQVTGWVPDQKTLLYLQNQSALPNLLFDQQSDAAALRPQAILAVAWAHQIFSRHGYNFTALIEAVRNLLDRLPSMGNC